MSNFVLFYGRMSKVVDADNNDYWIKIFHWNSHNMETFTWYGNKQFPCRKKNNNCFMMEHKKKIFIKIQQKKRTKIYKMKIIWMKTSGKINKTKMGKNGSKQFSETHKTAWELLIWFFKHFQQHHKYQPLLYSLYHNEQAFLKSIQFSFSFYPMEFNFVLLELRGSLFVRERKFGLFCFCVLWILENLWNLLKICENYNFNFLENKFDVLVEICLSLASFKYLSNSLIQLFDKTIQISFFFSKIQQL